MRDLRSCPNLERSDLVAIKHEDELQLDRTARKISGEPVRNDRLAIPLSDREWFDRVLIFLLRFGFPFSNGVQTFDGLVFVPHHRIFGKALCQGLSIAAILGRDVKSDWPWKIV